MWDQLVSGWDTPGILSSVNATAAAQLRVVEAHLPAGSELVVAGGVVGGFADRQAVYPVEPAPQNPIPVTAPAVVFVFTNQGEEGVAPAGLQADAAFVAHRLGAATLLQRDGVTAYVWRPAPAPRRWSCPPRARRARRRRIPRRRWGTMAPWHTTAGSASPPS